MRLIVALLLLFFSTTLTFGQILERTEDRAKQKANRRVDNKIDQGLDKGLDAIEGIFKKKDRSKKTEEAPKSGSVKSESSNAQESDVDAYQQIFSGGDAEVKESYSYDQSILLGVQTFSSKGKPSDEIEMKMFFANNEPSMGMEMTGQAVGMMIYDFEAYQMITLIDNAGQKIGMTINLDPALINDESDDKNDGDFKFVKTGNSKVISGYNCQEYKLQSSNANSNDETFFWVTKDINVDWMLGFSNAMNSNKNMNQSYNLPAGYPDGSVIQVISEAKNSNEKSVMTLKEYKKNDKKTISTKGYQMMNMGNTGY